jgi:hypothetical protein
VGLQLTWKPSGEVRRELRELKAQYRFEDAAELEPILEQMLQARQTEVHGRRSLPPPWHGIWGWTVCSGWNQNLTHPCAPPYGRAVEAEGYLGRMRRFVDAKASVPRHSG